MQQEAATTHLHLHAVPTPHIVYIIHIVITTLRAHCSQINSFSEGKRPIALGGPRCISELFICHCHGFNICRIDAPIRNKYDGASRRLTKNCNLKTWAEPSHALKAAAKDVSVKRRAKVLKLNSVKEGQRASIERSDTLIDLLGNQAKQLVQVIYSVQFITKVADKTNEVSDKWTLPWRRQDLIFNGNVNIHVESTKDACK